MKSSRRSELRAEAHKLTPVVIIGDKGLTDAVIAEIDRSLKTHELIKVRAATDDREARKTWMPTICERTGAEAVQSIGKVFVIYRENPKEKVDSRRSLPPGGFAGGAEKPKLDARSERAKGRSPHAKPTVRRLKSKAERGKVPFERGKPRSPRAKPMERGAPTGISRPRSRTPSAPPESEPRRRRPRSSR
jgi:putative YhbY family RNA-binding protein